MTRSLGQGQPCGVEPRDRMTTAQNTSSGYTPRKG
ncbi:hypothetical protein KKC1_12120 [Calderihabitans maritimus]|uniref:Uncharacterized protein n=1 Tax=Calderihabitans maritimus TaxID=1246530 RepID=A0A1Z5HRA0_9FIRM|nr:hypothetical protein KKC1_12120 [Calderihabitans maritimus]